ncbi:MFS transporter, partial [Chloroflexota bacterium]
MQFHEDLRWLAKSSFALCKRLREVIALLSLPKIRDKLFYGWVITIASLVIFTFAMGIRFSFGVFFKSIESDFGLTRGVTSTIFSVYMLFCCVVSVLGGWALDRYGPRMVALLMGSFTGLSFLLTSQTDSAWQLFVTYGLLLALGTGGMYVVVSSTVSRWFDKNRGIALGIVISAGGLGPVILAPFATYLISNFDWRMAFLVIGLIAGLVMASLSLLLIKEPGDIGLLPDGAKFEVAKTGLQDKGSKTQPTGFSLPQALRTSNFWLLGFSWLLSSLNVHLLTTHLVPYAIDIGIPPMEAAVLLSIMGGVSIPGRLVIGRISDFTGCKPPVIICAILQVLALTWLIWADNPWMLYLFVAVFGFAWGGLTTVLTAQVGDIFGMLSIGAILGVINAGWTLGGAIGPAIAGFIFDATGSYSIAFAIGATAMLTATILLAL